MAEDCMRRANQRRCAAALRKTHICGILSASPGKRNWFNMQK
jgi:hypothetical protein